MGVACEIVEELPLANDWHPKERRWWMMSLFFGSCLLYASRNILPVCLADIASHLNWTRQDEGIVMGIFFWGYMLTQFVGGYVSDIFGGELVLPLTTVLWGLITIVFVLIPLASTKKDVIFHFFLLARFLLGIFQGFFYPGLASLMAKRVRTPERQFTYAFITSGSHAGTLFCGFVGSFMTEMYGWSVPFFFIGSMTLLWTAFVLQNLDYSSLQHSGRRPIFVNPPDVERLLSSKGSKASSQAPIHNLNWCLLIRQPAFWSMLLGNFVFNNTFYIILNWLPSYFHDNFPDAKGWIFNVIPWLIVVPCTLISGSLADHLITLGFSVTFVRKAISSVALLGTSLFLVLLPVVQGFYPSLFCMALVVACCGFHNSGILLNPQDIAPVYGGQVFGVMSTVGTIPGFTGVYLTGYILSKSHNWSTVFHFAVMGNLIGWLIYIVFGSSRPLV